MGGIVCPKYVPGKPCLNPAFRRERLQALSLAFVSYDPHHAQATCCKYLAMNPNFPDGLLDHVDEIYPRAGQVEGA